MLKLAFVGSAAVLGTSAKQDQIHQQDMSALNTGMVDYLKTRGDAGVRDMRAAIQLCVRTQLKPDVPDVYVVGVTDIFMQNLKAAQLNNIGAQAEAMTFKRKKMSQLRAQTKILPKKQARRLAQALPKTWRITQKTRPCVVEKLAIPSA
ncbi:MAG TPA: hypothetical protein ENJ46_05295 [Hellea balneolensis]|uniref:Uncharacterized protein n=1 Tax=Hellea balneolensis TaxID=287478 RepID=A0A7C3CC35_9PROT|nr:hypothetical protein [Hellea balneolensis]